MREVSDKARDMSVYRMQRAREDLISAQNNFKANDYRTANNRAYYAIFHSLRAVLALDEFDSRKHSGVIGEFRRRYIKTGVLRSEISDMIGDAFIERNKSDYDDMYILSGTATETQIRNAEAIIDAVSNYLTDSGVLPLEKLSTIETEHAISDVLREKSDYTK